MQAYHWEELFELLDSEWFISLRRRADNEIVLRSDLDGAEIPGEIDHDAIWRIITALRHQTASITPFTVGRAEDGQSLKFWSTMTRSISMSLKTIEARCLRGSTLDDSFSILRGSYPFLLLLEEELNRAFLALGVVAGVEHIHEVFFGSEVGLSGIGRIIKNFHSLIFAPGRFDRRDVTLLLIEELYWQLLEGAEDYVFSSRVQRAHSLITRSCHVDADEGVRSVCETATDDEGPMFHEVLRLACIYCIMVDIDVVSRLSLVVEFLLRHLLSRRWGCPALAWVPLNRCDDFVDDYRLEEALKDYGYSIDVTYLFQCIIDCLLEGPDRLLNIKNECDKLSLYIEEKFSASLNRRQCSIVLNALQAPETSQRIEPHRQHFGVTYPMARNDFL